MLPGTAIKTGSFTIYLKLPYPEKVYEIPNELLIGGEKVKLMHKIMAKCGKCNAAGHY